ncbi:hypothetical protein DFH11DRAFT_65932 [Phellopilus nigrolimitatus]|nr:hypothetical protein DFH11DRAFT_65932 [Phellopilus nigrolimitatus]
MVTQSLVLCLVAYLGFVFQPADASQKLEWTSPTPDAVYNTGDTITGEWTSEKPIVSPSVSLCTQGSVDSDSEGSDCGEAVWPNVDLSGNQYIFNFSVPDVVSESNFYLQVKDDFGNIMKSPSFALSPSTVAGKISHKDNGSGTTPANDTGNDLEDNTTSDARASEDPPGSDVINNHFSAQAPFDDSSGNAGPESRPSPLTESSGAASQVSNPGDAPEVPGQSPPTTGISKDVVPPQSALASRTALPTAAVAVPLAIIAATLAVSLALYLVHRRSLASQRARNAHLIDAQRSTSVCNAHNNASFFASAVSTSDADEDVDIEKATRALCDSVSNPSLHAHVKRRGESIYLPIASRYPVPKQDVRRERTRTYERGYGRSHDRSNPCSRPYSYMSYRSRTPSLRHHHEYAQSPLEDCARSLSTYHGRHSTMREHGFNYDRDDDGSTDSILFDFMSPQLPTPRLPRYDSYYRERPRAPLRSHSRHAVTKMDGYRYRKEDMYDAVSRAVAVSPQAKSHRPL